MPHVEKEYKKFEWQAIISENNAVNYVLKTPDKNKQKI